MHPQLQKAATTGDVTIFDRIHKGEFPLTDSDLLSTDSECFNIIQIAARYKQEGFIHKVFLSSDIKPELLHQLLVHGNVRGSNALHCAAWYGCLNAMKSLVDFYHSWTQNEKVPVAQAPWTVANKYGKTPLHDALDRGYDEIACYILSLDPLYLYDKLDDEKQSPLFLALKNGCKQVIEEILFPDIDIPVTNASFSGPEGRTVLHLAIINICEESLVRQLLMKLDGRNEVIWQKDSKGWTALHYAVAAGVDWQIELLLQSPPASNFFMLDQNSESPLLLAWKSGHHSAVQTILRCYPAIIEWRSENNTTVLHHIKLQSREEYQRILRIPETQRVLNITDNNGMTPLHQAICDGNFLLAELLFEMDGVSKAIENKEGKTPINLLIEKSHQSIEFDELKKRPGIIPRTSYLPYKADLKEVRGTVMVVAALLATITFTAAFTIPDATQKSTPAFVIFLLSDTFAMCCSLVVLFWLIWAMVEDDSEKSRKLADRSVFVLELSFYGTLVAFAAAVFPVASNKSLLLAIAITIICCFVPVLSSRTIISKLFKVKGTRRSPWNLCSRHKYQKSRSTEGTGTSQV